MSGVTCPSCAFENIEGTDQCEQCGQSLVAPIAHGSELEARLFQVRIRDLEPRVPLLCAPDTPLHEVIELLYEHSVGVVTVVENDQIVGIFSERDALMRLNADYEKLLDEPVRDYMTPNPATLEGRDKLAYALHKMDLGGYRHIPVTDQGQLTGIISVRHVLRYINEHLLLDAE